MKTSKKPTPNKQTTTKSTKTIKKPRPTCAKSATCSKTSCSKTSSTKTCRSRNTCAQATSKPRLTAKAKKLSLFHKIGLTCRIVICASFTSLMLIGLTSAARALTLVKITNEKGIPSSWDVASLGNSSTITVPISYWDQKADPCRRSPVPRQFEWIKCNISDGGLQQGLVKSSLGADGLPIPAYANNSESKAAGIAMSSQNVTGSDPVQSTDNFYRWFHEVDNLSKRYDRTITFNRVGENSYTYGGSSIFPLDDVDFSDGDFTNQEHNFHFTAHLSIPIKVAATGEERFDFSGDDDVWIFLNNQLVLDIGGLHQALDGYFVINSDGTISSNVEGITKTLNVGIKPGDVVNLDFFYAERSTSEANTRITITGMNWPISADSHLTNQVIDNKLVQYNADLINRDPSQPLTLTHLASHLYNDKTDSGFIPLNSATLTYTTTPDDPDSWQPLVISAPANDTSGFQLKYPLTLQPAGTPGDTLYFRYYVEPEDKSGTLHDKIAFLTSNQGHVGMAYDNTVAHYENLDPVEPIEPVDPVDPKPDQPDPDKPNPDPDQPDPDKPNPDQPDNPTPVDPQPPVPDRPIDFTDQTDDGFLAFLDPLGEVLYVPETGAITEILAPLFNDQSFASVILSQWFILANLATFAVSFSLYFKFRKF